MRNQTDVWPWDTKMFLILIAGSFEPIYCAVYLAFAFALIGFVPGFYFDRLDIFAINLEEGECNTGLIRVLTSLKN